MRCKVVYKHWKKDNVVLEVVGEEVPVNPKSDRIIIKTDSGVYEDIIRSTIVSKEKCD